MTSDGKPPAPAPAIDTQNPAVPPSRVDRVGESLRRVFNDAAAEPLPRALEDLLQKLR